METIDQNDPLHCSATVVLIYPSTIASEDHFHVE